jgi:predicted DsbA family dithiol-disulfide isomerase
LPSLGPFCYIGYKNLNAGVDLAKSKGIPLNIDLEFKPFLLDPTLTKESVNKRERYYAKFGGKERVDAMEQQMVERGKKVGIDL